jgi:sigma-B regulation protein RsbU (phosphoserine phosphatase)
MPSKRLQSFCKVLTWVELGFGFILIAMAVRLLWDQSTPHLTTVLVLTIASAFAYNIKVEFPFAKFGGNHKPPRISQAYSVNLLAVLLLGPWSGSLVAAAGVTLGDGIFRAKRRYALAVNAAVQFLTTYLTGQVYFAFGGIGPGGPVEQFLLAPSVDIFAPLILAAMVHTATNISLLVPAMIAEGRLIPQSSLLELSKWDFLSTLFFTPLSFYIFLIYHVSGGFHLVPPILFLLVTWVLVQRTLDLDIAKRKLDLTVNRLTKLTEISKAVSGAGVNPEEILNIILVNGTAVCRAPAAAIRLFKSGPRGEVYQQILPHDDERWGRFFQSESFQAIVDHIHEHRTKLLIDEIRFDNLDDWFRPELIKNYRIKSFLGFPIQMDNEIIGLFFIAGDRASMFTSDHIETLDYLSGEIAIAIRNAHIYHEIILHNERNDEDIKHAGRVQRNVLPNAYASENVRIEGRINPARVLSGDFFDVIELGHDRIGIAMGDVSGKGVPASLTMMSIISSVRVLAHKVKRPNEMLTLLNESLYESEASIEDFLQYSTGFYAILDLRTLRLGYSIAGSEKPLWWHGRQRVLTPLDGDGLPLGMFSATRYSVEKITLEPGDKIIFFTDGVTDAKSPSGARYGRQTFATSIEKNCLRGEGSVLGGLLNDITTFQQDAAPVDDIAIMVVEITGPPLGTDETDRDHESEILDASPKGPTVEAGLFNE